MTREAPHLASLSAVDVEERVLGCLIGDSRSTGEIRALLEPRHFFDKKNVVIYGAICRLHDRGHVVDLVTLRSELAANERLDEIGGVQRLVELMGLVASSFHVREWARILVDKYQKRALINLGMKLLRTSDADDVPMVINETSDDLASIGSSAGSSNFIDSATVMSRIADRKHPVKGIPMLMGNLDKYLNMLPKRMVIVGARPSIGKTTFVLNGMMNMARAGHPGLFISLEMSEDELVAKQSAILTGINSERITQGELTDDERSRIADAATNNGVWLPKLHIADLPALHANQLTGIVEAAKRELGVEVVAVDYLQCMDADGENGVARMSAISRACKKAAKSTGVRVIAISQLKRRDGAEERPEMSDLREAGQLEADGDTIVLLGRKQGADELSVFIDKNKTGPVGITTLPFELTSQYIGPAKYYSGPVGNIADRNDQDDIF